MDKPRRHKPAEVNSVLHDLSRPWHMHSVCLDVCSDGDLYDLSRSPIISPIGGPNDSHALKSRIGW